MHESISKIRSGAAKGAWVLPVPAACERLCRRAAALGTGSSSAPASLLLRRGPSASLTAEGRFKYVFPSSFSRDFLGERKRSLKEVMRGQFSMLQRYTRPQDFSSVKLNNSKRKKNERERFGDWVGDYKRAHTHTYMYTYTRIYMCNF